MGWGDGTPSRVWVPLSGPSTILGDLACSFSLFTGLLDRLKSGSGSSEELCIWPRFPASPRWSCTPDPTQKALRLSYWVRQEPKSRAQLNLLPPEVSPGWGHKRGHPAGSPRVLKCLSRSPIFETVGLNEARTPQPNSLATAPGTPETETDFKRGLWVS